MLWDFFKNKNYILLLLNSPEAPLTFSPTYLTGYKPITVNRMHGQWRATKDFFLHWFLLKLLYSSVRVGLYAPKHDHFSVLPLWLIELLQLFKLY